MQVVILAGGLGTRLQGVAPGTPKILAPVAGRPFVEHQFRLLAAAGVRDVVLCVGHLADRVEAHVGDGTRFGVRVRYSREDPARLLGTGGALINAWPLLEESFLVMYGDSYLPIDFGDVGRALARAGTPALMTVFRNEGRWDASNTRVEGDRVVLYSKKAAPGETDCIDYGLLAFRREALASYRGFTPPLDLAIIIGDFVRQGRMAAYLAPKRFYEIGKPEGLRELDDELRRKAEG